MAIYTRTLQMKTTRKVYSDLFSFETGATALGPFSTFCQFTSAQSNSIGNAYALQLDKFLNIKCASNYSNLIDASSPIININTLYFILLFLR